MTLRTGLYERRWTYKIEFFVPERGVSIFCDCEARTEEEAHEIAHHMLARMGLAGKAVSAVVH